MHCGVEWQPPPALLCQCIGRQSSSPLCCCAPAPSPPPSQAPLSSPALSPLCSWLPMHVCVPTYTCLGCRELTGLKEQSWKRTGASVPLRRAQQNATNVLAIYSHLRGFFFLGPPQLLGAAHSELSCSFSSPWPAAFLALPTLGLSAPCMHLCRPELYLVIGIYLESVVSQGVYPCSFLASCSSVALQRLS